MEEEEEKRSGGGEEEWRRRRVEGTGHSSRHLSQTSGTEWSMAERSSPVDILLTMCS